MPQMRHFSKQYPLCNAADEMFRVTIFFVQRHKRDIPRHNIIYAMNEIFRDTISLCNATNDTISFITEEKIFRYNIIYAILYYKIDKLFRENQHARGISQD